MFFGAPENTKHRSICDQICVEQCVFIFVLVLDNIFVFVYLYFEICRAQPKLECAQAKLAELLSHGQGRLFLLHLCTVHLSL